MNKAEAEGVTYLKPLIRQSVHCPCASVHQIDQPKATQLLHVSANNDFVVLLRTLVDGLLSLRRGDRAGLNTEQI